MSGIKLEGKSADEQLVTIPATILPSSAANAPAASSGIPSAISPSPSVPARTGSPSRPVKRKVPEYDELDPEFVSVTVIENGIQRQSSCHKALATHYSSVLRATFIGQRRTTTLWNTTHNAFAIVVRFFYTEKIHDRSDQMPPSSDLIEAYLLAERLYIPKLQNLTIEGVEYHQRKDGIVQTRMIPRIYSETKSGSPLRRLVAHHVARLRLKDFHIASEARPQYYPVALLVDVITVLKMHGSSINGPDMKEFKVPVPDT